MPRKNLFRSQVLPYHVTARVNNREPFPLPLREVWKIITQEIRYMQITCGVEIQALVLMPNHFHLIITTAVLDLGRSMNIFMSQVTRQMNLKSGRSGRLFDKKYGRTLVGSPIYYAHALKYVYRNPVKAGLSRTVQDWEFGTLHGLLGKDWLPLPLHYTRMGWDRTAIYHDNDRFLEWLNRPTRKEHVETIGRALKRERFKLPKIGSNRKPHPLELEIS